MQRLQLVLGWVLVRSCVVALLSACERLLLHLLLLQLFESELLLLQISVVERGLIVALLLILISLLATSGLIIFVLLG